MDLFPPSLPDRDIIKLRALNGNTEIDSWQDYKFNQHFMTPADGFSFTVAANRLTDAQKRDIRPGAKVQLVMNDLVQATGYIDKVNRHADRGAGTEWDIDGRDVLGPVVDSTMDPLLQFKKGMTLLEILDAVLGRFGLKIFDEGNAGNRNVITGQLRGTKTSKKGKTAKGKGADQLQPHPKEGCFEFLSRIFERHGLMLWARADGEGVVIGEPDFEQAPIGILTRQDGNANTNIEKGSISLDISEQPHMIIADGFSGGAEFGKSRIKVRMMNPALDITNYPELNEAILRHKDAKLILDNTFAEGWETVRPSHARINYLHDDESHTLEQLEYFVRREMTHKLKRVLEGKYTVTGHTIIDKNGKYVPACVDTILRVEDEVCEFSDVLWVLSRTFNRSRNGGTTCDLDLIRPYSIVL